MPLFYITALWLKIVTYPLVSKYDFFTCAWDSSVLILPLHARAARAICCKVISRRPRKTSSTGKTMKSGCSESHGAVTCPDAKKNLLLQSPCRIQPASCRHVNTLPSLTSVGVPRLIEGVGAGASHLLAGSFDRLGSAAGAPSLQEPGPTGHRATTTRRDPCAQLPFGTLARRSESAGRCCRSDPCGTRSRKPW